MAVDIGGDWYSLVDLSDDRFGFVVGDVSGRGVGAATVMAQVRFTIRAYLIEGHDPAEVLAMCASQIDIERDGHFATALVGVGDARTGRLVMANAGHLNPLLVADGPVTFLSTRVGSPLGVGEGTYSNSTVTVPAGAVVIGYTDGLVERRGESIDIGLDRMARAAAAAPKVSLDDMLSWMVSELVEDDAKDDVAMLAVRRLSI
jgi:serine phosphatase RsbU (regulator of sigma subunit)